MHSPTLPLLTLIEGTLLHPLSLLLEAKRPHTCKHTYMKNTHFGAQTHFVRKHDCAHAHWIFNLCPIFLPFWSSATTAAFPRRQVFSQFSTMGTGITHKHTHTHRFGLPSWVGLLKLSTPSAIAEPIPPHDSLTHFLFLPPSHPGPDHHHSLTGSTHHYSGCLQAQGAPA